MLPSASIKYKTWAVEAFILSGGHPPIQSQYAITVFRLSAVGVLPKVPISPFVQVFNFWDVDFEPS